MINWNDIKTNDLLIARKSFYCYRYYNADSVSNMSQRASNFKKIDKESILLVINNNFGNVFKDRYMVFLSDENQVFFTNEILEWFLNDCFESLNGK